MTKILYEKPFCQTLVIRFGGNLLLNASDGVTGSRSDYDDFFNLDDDDED